MKCNVIILTNGLSGSSVLAGLIGRAGYWLGSKTNKASYDTFENSKLVELNIELLRKAEFYWPHSGDIPPPSVEKIVKVADATDLGPYRNFVSECDEHTPWLWKDPRLAYTIHFWKRLINLEKTKFILLTRDLRQTWTGQILREKVPIPFEKLKIISKNSLDSALHFLKQVEGQYISLSFEDVIMEPSRALANINSLLNIDLDLDELKKTYKGQLYRKRWSAFDYLKAKLKFLGYKFIIGEIIEYPRRHQKRTYV